MPAITYFDFGGGLDRRLSVNVQDASRLWVLRNAFVTQGKKIKKRPGLKKIGTGLSGYAGLAGLEDYVYLFYTAGTLLQIPSITGPAYVAFTELDQPASTTSALEKILYSDIFQGYAFVVAKYADGTVAYHYLDGGPQSYITDANCPNSVGVTKAASRLFAPDGEVVRYCKAGDPRDWTTASDAGFLPATLQQDTRATPKACGTFQDALVVLFPESSQIWDVAVDPSANKIRKRLFGVGSNAPQSLASFANDLMFLSQYGFRSITAQTNIDRIDDADVGVPIDSLVSQDLPSTSPSSPVIENVGIWINELGQYWCLFDSGAGSKAWVYSYSKTSKIACWSEYTFPVRLTDITTQNGKVYLRSETDLYELSESEHTDDGESINVEVQMAFQDAKSPGVLKQFHSADFVFNGAWDVSYLYDPRDQSKETVAQNISGDTRPGDLVPVEVSCPAIAPIFRHSADEAAQIDAVTMYYETLGLMG